MGRIIWLILILLILLALLGCKHNPQVEQAEPAQPTPIVIPQPFIVYSSKADKELKDVRIPESVVEECKGPGEWEAPVGEVVDQLRWHLALKNSRERFEECSEKQKRAVELLLRVVGIVRGKE